MSMSIDNKRFLRRHFPTFASYRASDFAIIDQAVDGETIALRSDGVVFFEPNAHTDEVWVAWVARSKDDEGTFCKTSPAPRRVCSLEEYNEEMATRSAEIADLLGQ